MGVAALALSAGPALVGKAVVPLLGLNQMIEEGNAEEVAGLAQPFGQDAIFGTWHDIARRMIMRTCDVKSR